jgi:dsRNA-specific ribonuclease
MQVELDEIRRLAHLPLLLDLETEERVFSHKSLFARPAHVHVEDEEPQDYERCASAGAFVPRSVQFESDHNPRLAFLGDQVLSFIATEVIFERYPNARPSFLTVCHLTRM